MRGKTGEKCEAVEDAKTVEGAAVTRRRGTMLTRDTPRNNFINVESELLISRGGYRGLFYCDTCAARARSFSRMQHLGLFSLCLLGAVFSSLLSGSLDPPP